MTGRIKPVWPYEHCLAFTNIYYFKKKTKVRLDGRVVNVQRRACLMCEVETSNSTSAKFYTALQTVRRCFNIYTSVLFWRYVSEAWSVNSLQAKSLRRNMASM